jgi:hypothetical protein
MTGKKYPLKIGKLHGCFDGKRLFYFLLLNGAGLQSGACK